jgi:hypothetical protein
MIISHKYKFIFIKTHKTASTSVEIDLASKCADTDIVARIQEFADEKEVAEKHIPRNDKGFKNHMTIENVRNNLKNMKKFNSYFKFCVEREPVDKLLSHFYWKYRLKIDDFFYKEVNFLWEQFLNFPLNIRNPNLEHWTIDGELAVDKILRYENLGFDIDLSSKAKVSLRKDKALPIPNITNEQIEQVYRNWKVSNSFTGYKIEDCKYYEN